MCFYSKPTVAAEIQTHFPFDVKKLNATREKECPDFPLKGGQALGIPATVTEAKAGSSQDLGGDQAA